MRQITLPRTGTFEAWRDAARGLLAEDAPSSDVLWTRGAPDVADLFAHEVKAPTRGALTVPKGFLTLARQVVWHSDPERFARLYSLLIRLTKGHVRLTDRGDPALAKLNAMAKEIGRDKHKMTAFVRFREIGDPAARRRQFAAWFEPTHYIMEPSASFFANRFGDMDWTIFTPDLTAHFEDGMLRFTDGMPKPPLPEDATEDLWRTYYRNIFNPARLKVSAMQAEMPKKYWKNLPEASLIPELIAGAEARARDMANAAPTLPPNRADRITERLAEAQKSPEPPPDSRAALESALHACTRCPIAANATQAVPGEGPEDADLMIVGEQPGDQEDLAGRPFVGPAGQVFDRLSAVAGLDRTKAYVTNAVKHFKFTPRGRRRIHQRPTTSEIQHCSWWLDAERARVRPKLILAMGATALEGLTGSGKDLLKRRGSVEYLKDGTPVFITVHPSYLLRCPPDRRAEEESRFTRDLRRAHASLAAQTCESDPSSPAEEFAINPNVHLG